MRAVLYARVSTDDGGQNPETQLGALGPWAASRGWTVVAEEVDEVTGDETKRRGDPPGLRRALERLERKTADVLVVFAADRIVRSPAGLLSFVSRVQAVGGRVASMQDGADLDTTTDVGELLVFLRGWYARMELRLIRGRTRAGMARAKAAGVRLGRPTRDLPEDLAARLQARRQGGTSLRQLAQAASSETEEGWDPSTLARALKRACKKVHAPTSDNPAPDAGVAKAD